MIKELKLLKSCPNVSGLNYLLIPVSVIEISKEGAKVFNKIYQWILHQKLNIIERTSAGGISSKTVLPAYDIRKTKTCVELTVILDGECRRVQFRTKLPESKTSGRNAFQKFKRLCKNYGINLDDYVIENGIEVKKEIEKPLIGASHSTYYDIIFNNVNHIDFHSSYPAGLINTHPEFKNVIKYLYEQRNKDEDAKNILNFTIGFFQSISGCGAKWAHLSRDSIKDNNDRIRKLAQTLIENDRIVIAYNTDGIWYKGAVYHGKGEGEDIGEWHNDFVNCKFRMKSAGAYEFISPKDGYVPVVRGVPNVDKENWSWGSIYKNYAQPELYIFDEKEGVILNENQKQ